ncbi:MAG TPA: BACON domain-containing carbohydrate-binding protein, partial [Ignavibacteriaceae bacterium]|nr:BACON domain-containing carbohydrate-binding protein [Ignavibacteriaceae bacterium]
MRILMLLLTLLIAGNVMAQKEDVKFNFGFNKEFKTSNSEKIIIDGKEDLGTIAATGAMESAPFIVGDANSLFCVYEVQGTRRRIDIKRSTDNGATWVFWASAWADNYNFNSPQAFISNNYFYLTVGFEYSPTDWDIIVYKAEIGAVPTNEEAAYINQETIFETKPSIIVNGSTMYIACLNTTTNTISVYSGSINSGFTKTDIFSSFVYPSAGYFFRIDGTNGSGTDIFTFNSGSQVYAYSRSESSWSNILATTGVGTRSAPSVGSYGSNWIVGYQYGTTGIYYRINGSTTEHYLADGKFPTFDMTNSPTGYVAATYTRNNLIYKKTSGVAQLPTFGSEVALFSNQLSISTGDFISMWPSNSNAGVAFCNVDTPTDYDIYFASLATSSGGDGNDVPTSATAISSIPHTGNYEINPEGDIDWYRVNLTANSQYTFANSSSTNFDSEFYLYGPGNSTGSTIGPLVENDDDDGPDNQPLIIYTPTTAGYYYLRVAYYLNDPTATKVKETKTENILTTGAYTLSITAQTSQPILSVTPDNRDVTSASGTTTFSVSNTGTGTMSYTSSVTTGSAWCTITSGGTGSNSGTINVSYTANTGAARTAQITVTATGATGSPKIVTVIQGAAPTQPILSVTPDNRDVTSASGTTTFSVSNTGTGTMSYTSSVTTGSTWCNITSGGSGSNSGTINVSYTANTGAARTAQITVTATGATGSPKIVTVTQAAHSGHGWVVTPNLQFNMSIIAQLYFTNVLTTNTADAIGAFVGTECRGIANPQGTNGLLFLTVGSNLSSGETITFKAWKSSTNEIQPIAQTIPFQNMGEIGTLTSPFRMDAGVRTLIISFGEGYTWFSVNVNPGNMSLNSLFVPPQLNPASNDRVTGQTQFSSWSGTSWFGSLTTINPVRGYVMKLSTAQVCTLQGQPVAITPISLESGYTWLGYLPQNSLPVNTALAGITPAPAANDRIISQTQFATWSGSSWIGSLTTMEPGKGYVIKLTNASTLVYPSTAAKIDSVEHKLLDSPNWVPVPNLQFNM